MAGAHDPGAASTGRPRRPVPGPDRVVVGAVGLVLLVVLLVAGVSVGSTQIGPADTLGVIL